MTPAMVKMGCNTRVVFPDFWSVEVIWSRSGKQFLVVLVDPMGGRHYGWHQIPGSCMHIPTSNRTWTQVKWAVAQHAKLHR